MTRILKTRVVIWTVILMLALVDVGYFAYLLHEHRAVHWPPIMGVFGLGYSLYHFNLLRLGKIE